MAKLTQQQALLDCLVGPTTRCFKHASLVFTSTRSPMAKNKPHLKLQRALSELQLLKQKIELGSTVTKK